MRKDKDNSMKNKITEKPNIIHLKSVGACEGHLCVVLGNEMSLQLLT